MKNEERENLRKEEKKKTWEREICERRRKIKKKVRKQKILQREKEKKKENIGEEKFESREEEKKQTYTGKVEERENTDWINREGKKGMIKERKKEEYN